MRLLTSINDLPVDCLLHIFSEIPSIKERVSLQRVCKKWQHLLSESIRLDFKSIHRTEQLFTEKEVQRANKRCSQLDIKPPTFLKILSTCSNLKEFSNVDLHSDKVSLNLHSLDFYMKYNKKLPQFYNLRSLSLVQMNVNLKDSCLVELFQRCPHLVNLEVSNCILLDGSCLLFVPKGFKSLKIEDCPHLVLYFLYQFLRSTRYTLTCFHLGRNCIPTSSDTGKSGLLRLISRCSKLENLHLDIEKADITPLGRLANIHSLSLRCLTLPETVINNVVTGMPNLRTFKLNIYGLYCSIGDNLLRTLSSRCTQLTHIGLFNLEKISDTGLLSLTKLIKLKDLTLFEMESITNAGLNHFLEQMQSQLKSLVIGVEGAGMDSNIVFEKLQAKCILYNIKLDYLRMPE